MPYRPGIFTLMALLLAARPPSAAQTPDVNVGTPVLSTLGPQVKYSPIVFLQVAKVDKQNKIIHFEKVSDFKGKSANGLIEHRFTNFRWDRDTQAILAWAEHSRSAVCFYDKGAAQTCLGNFWYASSAEGPSAWEGRFPLDDGS